MSEKCVKCHKRRPYSRKLCRPCYDHYCYRNRNRHVGAATHEGLVKIPVPGWGCACR